MFLVPLVELGVVVLIYGVKVGGGEEGVVPVKNDEILADFGLLEWGQPHLFLAQLGQIPHPHLVLVLFGHSEVALLLDAFVDLERRIEVKGAFALVEIEVHIVTLALHISELLSFFHLFYGVKLGFERNYGMGHSRVSTYSFHIRHVFHL